MYSPEELMQEPIPGDLQEAVERLLGAASKNLREVITACSIPNWFNEEILRTLQAILAIDGDPAEFQSDILAYAFVQPYHGLGFSFHEDVRSILGQQAEADLERAISLHEGMLRFFDEKAEQVCGAEKNIYIRERGYHARKLGALYLAQGAIKSASTRLLLAVESYEAVRDLRNLIRTFRVLGRLHLNVGEIDRAESAYLMAIKLAQDLQEAELYEGLLKEISNELVQRHLWERALRIYSKGEDEAGLAALYAAQAHYLRDNQELDAARRAYLRSRDIYLHLGDSVAANEISLAIRALMEGTRALSSQLVVSPDSRAPSRDQKEQSRVRQPIRGSTMQKTLKIFISSTTSDLGPERDAVERAITSLNLEAIRSEKVGSQSVSPREACRIMAQECDLYLGILGGRYGFTLKEGCSATEFEFNTARQAGRPILLYRKRVPEEQLESEQEAFIERVGEFDSGYYIRDFDALDVPDQLIEWVQQDIQGLLSGVFRDRMPDPQLRPVPPSGQRLLIASLGRSPGAVTGLAHALKHTGTPIDRVRTVSTSEFQVQRAVSVVHEELQAQGLTDYDDVCIGSPNITSDREAQDFKAAFARLLGEAREVGDEVAIGIAGGRTVMGALLTLVAQMEAPPDSYLYQLTVPDAIEEDGRIPAFFHQSPQRRKEVLRPMAYHMDQCHLVKVPFARFGSEEE